MALPPLTSEQRSAALEKAAAARRERATVKNLAGGEQNVVPFADLNTYLVPTARHSDTEGAAL